MIAIYELMHAEYPSFINHFEDLKLLELLLPLGTLSTQNSILLSIGLVVTIGHTEIREKFIIAMPQPDLRVAHNQKVVIMRHRSLTDKYRECSFVGEGQDESAIDCWSLGRDGIHGEGSDHPCIFESDDEAYVGMLIDVLVEVSFVESIESVEQFGIKYFLFGIFLYLLAEEVFLIEVIMQYFSFEFMQIV